MLILYLLVLSALNELAIYNVGMITGAYYKVLGDKDFYQFWIQTLKALLMIIVLAIIKSCKEYVVSTVYIESRKHLTQKIHSLYFTDLWFYRLNVLQTQKDNLDQRITQDVDTFCRHLSNILPVLIVSPFTITFYSYRSFITIGYLGPTGCLVFFILSTVINKSLISSVLNYVYLQQKREGDFRYQHIYVRNNSESIALQSGNHFELYKSQQIFNQLISIQEKLILREFGLKSSVYLFDYLGSIVSFLVLSFPLFAGNFDSLSATQLSELISQNTFVSMYLINCFTQLIDSSLHLTTIGGTAHRIAEVFELIDCKQNTIYRNDCNNCLNNISNECSLSISEAKIYFKFTNVSIVVPKTENKLIDSLNFEMTDKCNLLISGPSGTAKTSIIRVLKGIWNESNGRVERFLPFENPNIVLFLPQKPVLTTGSLLEQISYPLRPETNNYQTNGILEQQIYHYMKLLDLNQILDRIDNHLEKEVEWNWSQCLSPGEQQRINFVRLFYHKPLLAVLDESTSAVSPDMERKLYTECKRLNIHFISCGHRKSLEEYHSHVLRIIKSEDPIDSNLNHYIIEKL